MKKTIILVFILLAATIYAQEPKQILVGHTWKITSLKMNNDVFVEAPNTCIYATEITFIDDTQLTLNRPCLSVKNLNYSINNNVLILNQTDTLTISNVTTSSFQTTTVKKATDEDGNKTAVTITTTYGLK